MASLKNLASTREGGQDKAACAVVEASARVNVARQKRDALFVMLRCALAEGDEEAMEIAYAQIPKIDAFLASVEKPVAFGVTDVSNDLLPPNEAATELPLLSPDEQALERHQKDIQSRFFYHEESLKRSVEVQQNFIKFHEANGDTAPQGMFFGIRVTERIAALLAQERYEEALPLAEWLANKLAADPEFGSNNLTTFGRRCLVVDILDCLGRYEEALRLAKGIADDAATAPDLGPTDLLAIAYRRRAEELETIATKAVSPHIRRLENSNHGDKMVEDDRFITKDGIRYAPLSMAAQMAQAPRQTLLNWIKNNTTFGGRPLQSYNSSTAGKIYLSEESIKRVASRFVRWPSQEPAGAVLIGQTDDQTGFLALPAAARLLGISPRTLWLWVTRGKAPVETPLDIIRCTTSNYFYIRQKDVLALQPLVPRSGLQRGRRPHIVLQP